MQNANFLSTGQLTSMAVRPKLAESEMLGDRLASLGTQVNDTND